MEAFDAKLWAAKRNELLTEAAKMIADVQRLIRKQDALIEMLDGDDKDEAENALVLLEGALKEFIAYRDQLA